MAVDPTVERLVWPLLGELRAALTEQLTWAGRRVCRFPLVVGDSRPPSEFCDCECPEGAGMAWVRLVSLGAPRNPRTARSAAGCGASMWSASVELGVYRCDTTLLGEDGTPPDEATVTSQAGGLVLDAAVLRRAVRCSQWLDTWDVPWTADALVPVGPSGGCVGMALSCQFELIEPCGCPQAPPEGTAA